MDLTRSRRADGWGHLLGDCGSGAWIGRAGLEAAPRAYDGLTCCHPRSTERNPRGAASPLLRQ